MKACDNLEQKYQLDEHIKKTIAQKKQQLIKKFFYQLFSLSPRCCLSIFRTFPLPRTRKNELEEGRGRAARRRQKYQQQNETSDRKRLFIILTGIKMLTERTR